MAQTAVYSLFVDNRLAGRCAAFETATALAEEYVDITARPRMRIECTTQPPQMRVWTYEYLTHGWIEVTESSSPGATAERPGLAGNSVSGYKGYVIDQSTRAWLMGSSRT